jgi:hypothetical protein
METHGLWPYPAKGTTRKLTYSIPLPHLISLRYILEQPLLQRLRRTNPSHTQCTRLFQPDIRRHDETHVWIGYQEV